MKKIEIKNESDVIKSLNKGLVVSGRLVKRRLEGGLTITEFIPYNRSKKRRIPDVLICHLEHGWVKESTQRIKVHESLPKHLGMARLISILERDMRDAKNALINKEMEESL